MPHSIWRRYSEFARRAILFAHEEAVSRGESLVRCDHLLLGLLRDEGNNAVALLRRLEIDPGALREQVRSKLPQARPESRVQAAEMTLEEEGISAIHRATREADADRRGRTIGTESLLRGLASECSLLADLGCTIERIQDQMRLKGVRREPNVRNPLMRRIARWRSR